MKDAILKQEITKVLYSSVRESNDHPDISVYSMFFPWEQYALANWFCSYAANDFDVTYLFQMLYIKYLPKDYDAQTISAKTSVLFQFWCRNLSVLEKMVPPCWFNWLSNEKCIHYVCDELSLILAVVFAIDSFCCNKKSLMLSIPCYLVLFYYLDLTFENLLLCFFFVNKWLVSNSINIE